MTQVEQQFLPFGERRGGELFLPPEHAIRLVRRCRELNVPVLGVEGFISLNENAVRPQLDQMLDLSADPESGWAAAEAFLTARLDTGLMFVVCLGN